jgi:ABC-type nitrate/sulfonate/bicarbonate transport system ATPase subunit/ABC-type nitrate/sulfonate/bicarbonate transport system permease component
MDAPRADDRRSAAEGQRITAQYAAGLLIFFALWWGGSLLAGPTVLPGPRAVLARLAEGELYRRFFPEVGLTLVRALAGFSLAWVLSFPLGLLMGANRAAGRMGFFPLFLFQGAPPLLWITPLVLWLGTRGAAAPAVAFLVTMPLLTSHIYEARRQIPEQAHQMFLIYNPRRSTLWRELYLPRLLPAVRTNIHLGIMTSIKSAMVAEWFAAQNGFGRVINTFYQFFDLESFFVWALLFLLSMALLSLGIRGAVDRLLPAYLPPTPESMRQPWAARKGGSTRHAPGEGGPVTGRIEARELRMGFGRRELFSNVSLSVEAGTPLIVSGRSGCGKTTLLKCLTGLYRPWSGTVSAPQRSVLLFQEDALLEHRDALGNVLLPSLPGWSADDSRRARESLKLWGLEGWEHHYPHQLSGGMRKRLAMARAWYFRADAIMLDEPFINLDREARQALWERFFSLHAAEPIPAIIITHYPEEVEGSPGRHLSWEELLRS